MATKTKGLLQVDLWYTGTYEFMNSGWNLGDLAMLQDYFTERVQFQPRSITTRCLYCAKSTQES
jgi:hypothetical protein